MKPDEFKKELETLTEAQKTKTLKMNSLVITIRTALLQETENAAEALGILAMIEADITRKCRVGNNG